MCCRKLFAELIGTFWLVLGGCGTAIFAGAYVGNAGVALAFGLTVLTMAFAIGPISGCHLNPAVTIGLGVSGRFDKKGIVPYILAQCIGAILAAVLLYVILTAKPSAIVGGFAANGYGEHSPDGYGILGAIVAEIVLTFMFVFVILGATAKNASTKFAPIAIGLCLTLVHLISIPITNTSVNPARSLSQALFADSWALDQLWLFIVMPIIGAAIAGLIWRAMDKRCCDDNKEEEGIEVIEITIQE